MSARNQQSGYSPLHWIHIREWEATTKGSAWAGLSDARLALSAMIGYIYRAENGQIAALGGVFWLDGRRPVGKFALDPEFAKTPRSRWVHRAAIEVLDLAHRVEPVIYAEADASIPAARDWLIRLGFEEQSDWWTHDVGCKRSKSSGVVPDQSRGAEFGDAHCGRR